MAYKALCDPLLPSSPNSSYATLTFVLSQLVLIGFGLLRGHSIPFLLVRRIVNSLVLVQVGNSREGVNWVLLNFKN